MKSIFVRDFGGPENMVVHEGPDPSPGAGEVLVRQAFAGVNFADISQRQGKTRGSGTQYETNLPYVPGNEASGEIEAVGASVEGFAPGDRVAYRGVFGAYCDKAVVPADSVVKVPDDVELKTAAAVLTHGMTAHYVTHDAYRVAPGDWVLVHAAAGGTGGLVTQMAKRQGATVIATASTAKKLDHARSLGADHLINYSEQDFEAACRAIPGFEGLHAVLDNVSASTFEKNLKLMRPLGTLVIFGASSGPIPPFDLQRLNALGSLAIRRTNMKHYVLTRAALEQRASAVFDMVRDGLTVTIGGTFPLAEVGAAHDLISSRGSMGKVLLEM